LRDKLEWYLRRLQAMPPQEMLHRAGEAARARAYRFRPPVADAGGLEWTGAASALGDLALAWVGEREGGRAYVEACVEAFREGRVELMSHTWALEGGMPDWHGDPFSGRRFPLEYCFDIDYRHGGTPGEIRLVWELNRLGWVVPLAVHAVLVSDSELAATCDQIVDDWLAANPPYRGVNWAAGIEVGHHVLALLVLEELIGRLLPDGDRRRRRMQRVRICADWIGRFPSLYSSANNHRIVELVGSLLAGLSVDGLADPGELEELRSELETTAARQFSHDGVGLEQATHYAVYTLEWLLLARVVAAAGKRPMSADYDSLLEAAAGAIGALTDVGGNTLRYGDDDDASALSAVLRPADRIAAVVALAGGGGPRTPSVRMMGDASWSIGRFADPLGITDLVFDHAPLGFGGIAAHAHADALSVWLSVAGQPVFVEAGTYLYQGAPAWRAALRATALHNTLEVAGLSSSVAAGDFNWRQERAACRLIRWEAEPFRAEADHDGYLARLGVRHRRTIARPEPGLYVITDSLVGDGSHEAVARWLVAPEIEVDDDDGGWTLKATVGPLRLRVSGASKRSRHRGEDAKSGGWWSPHYGVLEPATMLAASAQLGGEACLVLEIDMRG
jgi:hypothetical protein